MNQIILKIFEEEQREDLEENKVYVTVEDWLNFQGPDRALFQLRRIGTTMTTGPIDDSDTPPGIEVKYLVAEHTDAEGRHQRHLPSLSIDERTQFQFLYKKHRIVFALDLSTSVRVVDTLSGRIVFQQLEIAVENCLTALLAPLQLVRDVEAITPEIHICIVGIGVSENRLQLIDLCLAKNEDIPSIMERVRARMQTIETRMAELFARERKGHSVSLNELMDLSLFTLERMVHDANPVVIVFTDGVTASDHASGFDSLLIKCIQKDVACSVVQISSRLFMPNTTLGYIPDSDSLETLCNFTNGLFVDFTILEQQAMYCKKEIPESDQLRWSEKLNVVHPGMILRSSAMGRQLYVDVVDSQYISDSYPWKGVLPPLTPTRRFELTRHIVDVPIELLIERKVKQGFKNAKIQTILDRIQISMFLEWRYDVVFEYHIVTSGGVSSRSAGESLLQCLTGPVEVTYYVITSLHQGSFKDDASFHQDRNKKRKKKTRKRKIVDFAVQQSQIDKSIEKFYKLSLSQSRAKRKTPVRFDQTLKPMCNRAFNTWVKFFHVRKWEIAAKIGFAEDMLDPVTHYQNAQHMKAEIRETVISVLDKYCQKHIVQASGLQRTWVKMNERGFTLVKLGWDDLLVASIQIGFFNLTPKERLSFLQDLDEHLNSHAKIPLRTESSLHRGEFVRPFLLFHRRLTPILIMDTRLRSLGPYAHKRRKNRAARDRPLPHRNGSDDGSSRSSASPKQVSRRRIQQHVPSLKDILDVRSYMWNSRWNWRVSENHSLQAMILIFKNSRFLEGFAELTQKKSLLVFMKKIKLVIGERELPSLLQFSMIPRANNLLDCELWVEPQIGVVDGTQDLVVCTQCRKISSTREDYDDKKCDCCEKPKLSPCNLEQFYYHLADWISESQTGVASVISTFDVIWNMLTTSKEKQKTENDMERNFPALTVPGSIGSIGSDGLIFEVNDVSEQCHEQHANSIKCTRTDGNMGTPHPFVVPFDVFSLITDPTVGHACFDYGLLHHTIGDPIISKKAKFQLHDMLTMALRRINLCEIQPERVFATMLSEKRILFLVLPPFADEETDPKLKKLDSFLLRLERVQEDVGSFSGVEQAASEGGYYGAELDGLRPRRLAVLDEVAAKATQLHVFEVSRRELLFSTKSDINKIEHRLKRQDDIIKRVLKMINRVESESNESDASSLERPELSAEASSFLENVKSAHHRNKIKSIYLDLVNQMNIDTLLVQECLEICVPYTEIIELSPLYQIVKSGPILKNVVEITKKVMDEDCWRYLNDCDIYILKCEEGTGDEKEFWNNKAWGKEEQGDEEQHQNRFEIYFEDFESGPTIVWNELFRMADSDNVGGMSQYAPPCFIRIQLSARENSALKTKDKILTPGTSETDLAATFDPSMEELSISIHCRTLWTYQEREFRRPGPFGEMIQQRNTLPKSLHDRMLGLKQRFRGHIADCILTGLLSHRPVSVQMICSVIEHLAKIPPKSKLMWTRKLDLVQGATLEIFDQSLQENTDLLFQRRELDTFVYFHAIPNNGTTGSEVPNPGEFAEETNFQIPFWILLSVPEDLEHISVVVHLPNGESKPQMRLLIDDTISKVCHTTSQKTLLHQLYQTRRCDPWLVSNKSEREDSAQNYFQDDQFACPLIHTMVLHVHQRVKLRRALREVTQALNLFSVENRRGLYVYREKDQNIVYFKTKIVKRKSAIGILNQNKMDIANFFLDPGRGESTELDSDGLTDEVGSETVSRSTSLRDSGTWEVMSNSQHRTIEVRFFGLRMVGPEIHNFLRKHLISQLEVMTEDILSRVLATRGFMLEKCDKDFLMSPTEKPKLCLSFDIPDFVDDPFSFLLFVTQNFSKHFLKPLILKQPISSASSFVIPQSDMEEDEEIDLPVSRFVHANADKFTFLFNSEYLQNKTNIAELPSSPVMKKTGSGRLGKGFFVVRLTMLDSKSNRPTFVRLCDADLFRGHPSEIIPKCTRQVQAHIIQPEVGGFGQMATIHGEGKTQIGIEVWCKRVMKHELFAECLAARYNQCLRELGLEIILEHQKLVPDSLKNFLDPFQKLHMQDHGFNSSMVKLDFSLPKPGWDNHELLPVISKFIADEQIQFEPPLMYTLKRGERLAKYRREKRGKRKHALILIGRHIKCEADDSHFEESMNSLSTASMNVFEDDGRLSVSVGGARTSFSTSMTSAVSHFRAHYYGKEEVSVIHGPIEFTRKLCHVGKIFEDRLEVCLYNWSTNKRQNLLEKLQKQIEWIQNRHKIGMSFIHQKLGLFDHSQMPLEKVEITKQETKRDNNSWRWRNRYGYGKGARPRSPPPKPLNIASKKKVVYAPMSRDRFQLLITSIEFSDTPTKQQESVANMQDNGLNTMLRGVNLRKAGFFEKKSNDGIFARIQQQANIALPLQMQQKEYLRQGKILRSIVVKMLDPRTFVKAELTRSFFSFLSEYWACAEPVIVSMHLIPFQTGMRFPAVIARDLQSSLAALMSGNHCSWMPMCVANLQHSGSKQYFFKEDRGLVLLLCFEIKDWALNVHIHVIRFPVTTTKFKLSSEVSKRINAEVLKLSLPSFMKDFSHRILVHRIGLRCSQAASQLAPIDVLRSLISLEQCADAPFTEGHFFVRPLEFPLPDDISPSLKLLNQIFPKHWRKMPNQDNVWYIKNHGTSRMVFGNDVFWLPVRSNNIVAVHPAIVKDSVILKMFFLLQVYRKSKGKDGQMCQVNAATSTTTNLFSATDRDSSETLTRENRTFSTPRFISTSPKSSINLADYSGSINLGDYSGSSNSLNLKRLSFRADPAASLKRHSFREPPARSFNRYVRTSPQQGFLSNSFTYRWLTPSLQPRKSPFAAFFVEPPRSLTEDDVDEAEKLDRYWDCVSKSLAPFVDKMEDCIKEFMTESFQKLRGLSAWTGVIQRLSFNHSPDEKFATLSKDHFKDFVTSGEIINLQEVDESFSKIISAVNNRLIHRHDVFLDGVASFFDFLTNSSILLHGADASLSGGGKLCPQEATRLSEFLRISPWRIKSARRKDRFVLQIRSESKRNLENAIARLKRHSDEFRIGKIERISARKQPVFKTFTFAVEGAPHLLIGCDSTDFAILLQAWEGKINFSFLTTKHKELIFRESPPHLFVGLKETFRTAVLKFLWI